LDERREARLQCVFAYTDTTIVNDMLHANSRSASLIQRAYTDINMASLRSPEAIANQVTEYLTRSPWIIKK
jgi:hypothetical protein